jgi:thiosulfate dehydrogenase
METLSGLLMGAAAVVLAACMLVSTACIRLIKKQTGIPEQNVAGLARMGLSILSLSTLGILGLAVFATSKLPVTKEKPAPAYDKQAVRTGPDPDLIHQEPNADVIAYGRDLIVHTNQYYGQNGTLRPNTINGLNCQSCHLEAGSKPFGNNYFAVQATYPQFRARSGSIETISKRVNDCIERSLNGVAIDSSSREMKAIQAYIRWLGAGVPKGEKPKGSGLWDLPYMKRPADPTQGRVVFTKNCASCHGEDGQGRPNPGGGNDYPPLWGSRSYNEAAGLFRLSRFAGFVKANMPFGATYQNPQLSDEEAWDVAAFVNSQPRPKHPFLEKDFPDISKKPFDHPFGPYADAFSALQHKFGPFQEVVDFYKKRLAR